MDNKDVVQVTVTETIKYKEEDEMNDLEMQSCDPSHGNHNAAT